MRSLSLPSFTTMIHSKLARRKVLATLLGASFFVMTSRLADAQTKTPRKKRRRNRDYRYDQDYRTPVAEPSVSPTPALPPGPPEPYRANPALLIISIGFIGVAGAVVGSVVKAVISAVVQAVKVQKPSRSSPVSVSRLPSGSPRVRSVSQRSLSLRRPVPEPSEAELDQLATEFFGDFDPMPVSPSPSCETEPEKPEWYVFRSGNAEGPYTKLQLLDVQKISDRTKVRRGEAEWQRAGEIPELAAYLTEK
ncbi:DUF4339 domain-containing protein [Microcoleus sp. AT9_B5]